MQVSLSANSVKSLLLVEDDDDVAALIEAGLEGDVHVFRARSIESARSVLSVVVIDAILLDWQLGNELGVKLLEGLPRNEGRAIPPTIVVSGDVQESHARKLGASSVLHKPFTIRQLRDAVQKLLNTVS